MNFNLSQTPDYSLQHSMTDELINLYGVQCKLMLVDKINQDDLVFGDYSHLKSNSQDIFTVFGLPENTESWDNMGMNYSEYGVLNLESINLYFSRLTIDGIFPDIDAGIGFEGILGNLLVLPNERIVEITDIEFQVPGVSNLFTNIDQKNVYKFICKTYDFKLTSEIPASDLGGVDTVGDYTVLDDYFTEMTGTVAAVDTEAEITPDTETALPVVATDEDSVFGSLG